MPLEILLCHRDLVANDQGVPDEYSSNFERLKSLIAQLFPEPYYKITTLSINIHTAPTLKFPLINFNPPIVIFCDRNEHGYGRIDDLYHYTPLIKHSRYFVLASVYDSSKESYDRLKKYFFDAWVKTYSFYDHYFKDKIRDVLIIDKNATLATFNLLANQATYTNFSRISELTDAQAMTILQSLHNLLIRGPLNDIKTPYDIKFGGIMDDIIQVTIPRHIHAMLFIIRATLLATFADAKQQLLQIVQNLKEISLNSDKPFSRSASTDHFYLHTLPLFIARSILKDNIDVKEKICKLTDENAQEILNNLAQFLIKDSSDLDRSYEVGFFGGNKHQITREDGTTKTTKLPQHIFQLLNSLINPKPESPKEKLSQIFDDIIVIADSISSSRKFKTCIFYTEALPRYIVKRITEKQPDYGNDSEQHTFKLR